MEQQESTEQEAERREWLNLRIEREKADIAKIKAETKVILSSNGFLTE